MTAINPEFATIGGNRLAIVNNNDKDNNSSTLLISYADIAKCVEAPTQVSFGYKMETMISGIPLSMSLFSGPDIDPSASANQISMFYALDVIENYQAEDALSLNDKIVVPTDPSDKTFTWNGNRLSASKESGRYYINIVDSGEVGRATKQVTLMGSPMASGIQNELILNKTDYTIEDIDEYKNINIGGSPLTVGRIGNEYYLVVKVTNVS